MSTYILYQENFYQYLCKFGLVWWCDCDNDFDNECNCDCDNERERERERERDNERKPCCIFSYKTVVHWLVGQSVVWCLFDSFIRWGGLFHFIWFGFIFSPLFTHKCCCCMYCRVSSTHNLFMSLLIFPFGWSFQSTVLITFLKLIKPNYCFTTIIVLQLISNQSQTEAFIMKLSIFAYLSTCIILVVNLPTFVDGLKCKSLSKKKKCNKKGDGVYKWCKKKDKCQTKWDLFQADDSKNMRKWKGARWTGICAKKSKKKPKECGDLTKKKCGKREDCRFLDDEGTCTVNSFRLGHGVYFFRIFVQTSHTLDSTCSPYFCISLFPVCDCVSLFFDRLLISAWYRLSVQPPHRRQVPLLLHLLVSVLRRRSVPALHLLPVPVLLSLLVPVLHLLLLLLLVQVLYLPISQLLTQLLTHRYVLFVWVMVSYFSVFLSKPPILRT